MTQINNNKRALLFGRKPAGPAPIRPPWALAEAAFLDACTACGDCVRACPEQILVSGPGRYPQVDFQRGACTFCARCVDVCGYDVYGSREQAPWDRAIQIADRCLAQNQIVCQSCGDACETEAIRFRPQLGGRVQLEIQQDACNQCGACIGSCPVAAIELVPLSPDPRLKEAAS